MSAILKVIACMFCLLATQASAQNAAGSIEFLNGGASVIGKSGERREAVAGQKLYPGDALETTSGRVHLRMVDGAYISIQPQSHFRIDEYAMGEGGKRENALLALLKGGLRTITGLIGKGNPQNYRLTTTVATIGIRGTEFAVLADEGTRVNVTEGIVVLCSDDGCIDIYPGQSGFVPDKAVAPLLTFEKARLLPQGQERPGLPSFVQAEVRSSSGISSALAGQFGPVASPPALAVTPLVSGVGGIAAAFSLTTGSFAAGLLGGASTPPSVVFAPTGELSSFIDCCVAANNFTSGVSTDFGADGIIAWGRWTGGLRGTSPLATMNYIAVLSSNNVAVGSIVRAYTSFASTAPTVTDGSGTVIAVGASNSVTGTLNVNFASIASGGGSLTYALSIPVAGQTFSIAGSANQNGVGTGFLGTTSTISSTGAGCTPTCTGNIPFGNAIQGVFTGASAERAGANYGFTSSIGQVSGAVVFQ